MLKNNFSKVHNLQKFSNSVQKLSRPKRLIGGNEVNTIKDKIIRNKKYIEGGKSDKYINKYKLSQNVNVPLWKVHRKYCGFRDKILELVEWNDKHFIEEITLKTENG